MEDDFNEYDGLLDDDPALDYILYEEMTQEEGGKGQGGKGCLGVIVLLLLPFAAAFGCLSKWI